MNQPAVSLCLAIAVSLSTVVGIEPARSEARDTTPSEDERALRELKTETWPRAYREQNTELLASILSDGFVIIDQAGHITTRRDELDALPDYAWTHDRFEYHIDHLEIVDGHTAIVAGTGRAAGVRENAPYCLNYRSSNVLVKRDGTWRAVLSHVSGVDNVCSE